MGSYAQAAHDAVVQRVEQHADRRVEFGQGEEPLVSQPGQDPALDDLDANLDLGLVTRFAGSGRQDRRAVVRRHLGIGPVHHRLVEAGAGDPGLEIVADQQLRHAAEVGEGTDVAANPVRQCLTPDSAGVGEARRPEHGHEDLRLPLLPACPVHHAHRAAGEVDEHSLARPVHLPQRRFQPPRPAAIQVAEPGVAEPLRRGGPILLPYQRQGHVGTAQLPMDPGPVRQWPLVRGQRRRRREQPRLQLLVIQLCQQRPGQARTMKSVQVLAHRRLAHAQAAGNGALGQAVAQPQPQNVSYLAHWHSLARHLAPLLSAKGEATCG